MFCCALLCAHSSFAIISIGRREPVALLCLSSLCLLIFMWLFLTTPRVCLQFVIVLFPDHTHYFFYLYQDHLVCGQLSMHFCRLPIFFFFKINILKKNLSGILYKCQTVKIQTRLNKIQDISVSIAKSINKRHQQAGKELISI